MITILLQDSANNLQTGGKIARLLEKHNVPHTSNGYSSHIEIDCVVDKLPKPVSSEIAKYSNFKDIRYLYWETCKLKPIEQ